jgi:hypothetical protein
VGWELTDMRKLQRPIALQWITLVVANMGWLKKPITEFARAIEQVLKEKNS